MNKTNHILARFNDEPALINEGSRPWFESCTEKASEILASMDDAVAAANFWYPEDDYMSRYQPYVVQDGVLQIPIKGVLMNGLPFQLGAWATGYEYIEAAMLRGLDDSNVKGIALIVDSPGGAVAGNFDLADKMYEMRGAKPIRAFAADSAYSAAYSLASSADSITVGRSGGVGSIGVVVVHTEYSKMLEANGVTATIIRSKPRKMEGNPYEALTDTARDHIQKRVDATHAEFVAIVARNRGMEPKDVDATDALTFNAIEAIQNGLADFSGSFDDALTAFVASFSEEDNDMATEKPAGFTEADLTTAVAQATTAERSRIQAILGSDAAKTRPTAAMAVALDTAQTVAEAEAFLAKLPEEAAAAAPVAPTAPTGAAGALFDAAMSNTQNPQIGAGDDDASMIDPAAAKMQEDSAIRRSFGLPGFKTATKE